MPIMAKNALTIWTEKNEKGELMVFVKGGGIKLQIIQWHEYQDKSMKYEVHDMAYDESRDSKFPEVYWELWQCIAVIQRYVDEGRWW